MHVAPPPSARQRLGAGLTTLALFVAATAWLSPPAAAQIEGRASGRPPAEGKPQADAKPDSDAKPQPDGEAKAEAKTEPVVSRVYDVRDLLAAVPNYPFTGKMAGSAPAVVPTATLPGTEGRGGGGAAGAAASADPAPDPREAAAEQLQRLILEAVAPETWRDNGGNVGAARMVNGLLIVTQTEANHKLLADLFRQLRETKAQMIRVRARWLLLQPGEVDALYKRPAGGGGAGAKSDKADKADKADKPESAFPEIDRDALEKAGGKGGHHRAETVCYNGQTVHVASGRARRVIGGVTAAVGTGAVAYEPMVETVRSGLVLQVTPLLSPGRPVAMLDVYSAFADVDAAAAPPGGAAPAPAVSTGAVPMRPGSSAGGQPAGPAAVPGLPQAADHAVDAGSVVDQYRALSHELRTTISVPLGRPVLVGGMTLDPTAKGGDAPQLYLVVELTASE